MVFIRKDIFKLLFYQPIKMGNNGVEFGEVKEYN
jgi:hypothetical protein